LSNLLWCQKRTTRIANETNITHPDERMQDARPLAAAEQRGQPGHRRMEHGQAGQRQQDEGDGGDPVVAALVRRVALDQRVAVDIISFMLVSFCLP
jgi:hypothetical protein